MVEPDIERVVELVRGLARYVNAEDNCHLDSDSLHRALFDPHPALFGHVAEVDGEVVGFALWFLNYSTWRASHGIYLEDLYVLPEHRGAGIGKQLLATLAAICDKRGYQRLEWACLNWNTPAITFYTGIGAEPQHDQTIFRLSDEPLQVLASQAPERVRS